MLSRTYFEKNFQRLTQVSQVFAICAVSVLMAAPGASQAASPHAKKAAEHVPGEVIIKFRDAATARGGRLEVVQTLTQRLGKSVVKGIHPLVTDPSLAVVQLQNDKLSSKAMQILSGEPSVVFSEPNYIYHALDIPRGAVGLPNDPDFAKQWGMYNSGQADSTGQIGVVGDDINIVPLWQNGMTGKKDVTVAIIDTGLQWDHPDLAANLYTNPAEIAGNNKDDDSNGFVDDIHGWNFAANSNTSSDDNGHGTHCAGVIGGVGNNGTGVTGINWNVSMMPVKFLDASGGGSLEGAVNAINYARMMKVRVMSNSWGGGGFSQAMFDAIKAAQDQGILFVAAAGNDGTTNDGDTPTYPSSYELQNVVSVAAVDNKGAIADFSNFGPKHVHVAAPGVNVYSTFMGSSYETLSGTSMATPHVSGISALLISEHPEWTAGEIKDRLIKTSTPASALRRKVMSKGVVNAWNAMNGIIPPNPDPDESLWVSKDNIVESEHPYKENTDQTWKVSVPGAKYIRVHFTQIEVEDQWDKLTIETPAGDVVDRFTGATTDYISEYIKGDTLIVRLKSDGTVNEWGFKVDKVQYIMDTPHQQ
jgi:hypothetical protein